jgi:hypothetical protein
MIKYRPNWHRVFGVAIIIVAHLLTGCTVIRTDNLQVHLLCKKDLLTADRQFNQDAMHHNHCDKKQQLFFSYSFGVH